MRLVGYGMRSVGCGGQCFRRRWSFLPIGEQRSRFQQGRVLAGRRHQLHADRQLARATGAGTLIAGSPSRLESVA